jgi:hypothetical protein
MKNLKMNTKVLMASSSVVMGIWGLAASFFPQEILKLLNLSPSELQILFVQIIGALYFGFAIMNWMAKNVLIGGIYAKPLCTGNFAHFGIAGLALLKATLSNPTLTYIWPVTIVYLVFAIFFGIVFYTNPALRKSGQTGL